MIVIKFGGHAMSTEQPKWISEIASRWQRGERFVIVHGGGPAIDAQLKIEGIESDFIDGYRITTPEVMRVVEYVLAGTVQRQVVRSITEYGIRAVGISGSDGNLLSVKIKEGGKFGLVGEVVSVDPKILETLLDSGFLPVVSPVSTDAAGSALNVNADLAAGAISGAIGADEMIFMTDVPGIYRNWPNMDSLIEQIDLAELRSMNFEKGMIPKVAATISALESGAKSVRIIDGKSITAFQAALAGKGGTWVSR